MKRIGLTLTFATILAFAARAGTGANPLSTPPAAQEIDRLIELLDHDDFTQREEASRQLVHAGGAAIAAVAEAAVSDSQEVAWRCGVILQQIGISGDETVMTDVIRAMAKLEKSGKRSFKQSGAEIIQRWRKHQDELALAAVRRLGGEVTDSAPAGFVGGFGGFGGGFAPPVAIAGPIIVDFDDVRIDGREAIKVEVLKELKVKIEEEAKPVDEPVEAIKPLSVPKLPSSDRVTEGAKTVAPRVDNKAVEEREEFKPDEVERFVKELRKVGIGVDPLTLRGPRKGAEAFEFEDRVKKVIEFEDLDDLIEEDVEVAPLAIPVFGGGFGGGFGGDVVVWDGNTTSQPSRHVRLGKEWKGTSADLNVLREVSGLATLELHDFDLDETAIKQISRLKKLRRLAIQHSKFEREKLLALKRANPQLSIYATGQTLLGVSGQPHAEGFLVTQVVAGSAAHNAGVIVGDIITQADGIKLTCVDELTIAIAHKDVGDPLPITFKRSGKLQEVEVTLGPRQAIQ